MFTWLKRHLRNNRGDANVSKTTMIAIVFVVGAILLVLVTSAFRNPINRWFNKVQADWFANGNGGFAYNDPYLAYERNENGSIKGLSYRITYSDGSFVEIDATDVANFPNGDLVWYVGGYHNGLADAENDGWPEQGGFRSDTGDISISADGKTLIVQNSPWGYREFTAYIPEP